MVEMEYSPDWASDLKALKQRFGVPVGIRVQAKSGIEKLAVELASSEADIIHLLYDEQSKESEGRLAKDSLLAVNRALAGASLAAALPARLPFRPLPRLLRLS